MATFGASKNGFASITNFFVVVTTENVLLRIVFHSRDSLCMFMLCISHSREVFCLCFWMRNVYAPTNRTLSCTHFSALNFNARRVDDSQCCCCLHSRVHLTLTFIRYLKRFNRFFLFHSGFSAFYGSFLCRRHFREKCN
jgi:hypothetical protein